MYDSVCVRACVCVCARARSWQEKKMEKNFINLKLSLQCVYFGVAGHALFFGSPCPRNGLQLQRLG